MKAIKLFLLAGVSLLALSSCQKAEKLGGQEIRFSASANPTTKTEYASSESGLMKWLDTDKVLVWSDEAVTRYGGESSFQYDLVPMEDGAKATLTNPAGTNGLVYVDGVDNYNFWASCPPVASFADAQAQYSISGSQAPAGDAVTETVEGVEKVTLPADMSQAFLLGSGTGPWMAYHDYTKTITLAFQPAFTAYEITIIGHSELDADTSIGLTSVQLLSGDGLAGEVTADFGTSGIEFTTTPAALTYTFPAGTEITKAKSLTFTVMALPVDAEGLQLKFNLSDGSVQTAKLKTTTGEDVTFAALKKNRLTGIVMKDKIVFKAVAAEYDDSIPVQLY